MSRKEKKFAIEVKETNNNGTTVNEVYVNQRMIGQISQVNDKNNFLLTKTAVNSLRNSAQFVKIYRPIPKKTFSL